MEQVILSVSIEDFVHFRRIATYSVIGLSVFCLILLIVCIVQGLQIGKLLDVTEFPEDLNDFGEYEEEEDTAPQRKRKGAEEEAVRQRRHSAAEEPFEEPAPKRKKKPKKSRDLEDEDGFVAQAYREREERLNRSKELIPEPEEIPLPEIAMPDFDTPSQQHQQQKVLSPKLVSEPAPQSALERFARKKTAPAPVVPDADASAQGDGTENPEGDVEILDLNDL